MASKKFFLDGFTLSLISTVVLASFFPVPGELVAPFSLITNIAVGLLFFLHGAKLSREAIVAGATHWRLHLTVLLCTFVLFPLLGVLLRPILSPLVTAQLYAGVLFLCTLPSTVQSSIAFTSIARGNVPAAVCSASASSLLGIFITPALVGLLLTNHSGGNVSPWHTVSNIVMQLLLPFIAGQLLRPIVGGWVDRNRSMLKFVDQGSILLVVYGAFSEALMEGLWHQIPLRALFGLFVVCAAILSISLLATVLASKRLGFNREDQITIIFCGSKKSLAAGIPMANVIFSASSIGAIVLPLMLFHQIQLMVCSALAQRWAIRRTVPKQHTARKAA
ncbi:sodium/bile acid cotransporter 7 [Paraburkholderia fungorum]|uniref:bile acid:sodium symporter family protein n=1 Tax=Paraburkholderia fungorum TaxID=134537 RepID=UPI000D0735C9|nr:bile acid:sodium symporter family protein [Paraburkholderia fungorum]PRZ55832.1 sodium/bile acid cotransporter 7 [Paraburkholderia fungorum]